MSIDVSVIVPVYKTEQYLRECLESIIAQTIFDRIEIILVNDGSPDHSPEICDEYAQKHPNISVIHQENAGVSAARNAGIKKATGQYIGFVDSDDCIFPEMVERLLEIAEKTNADMSVCKFVHCLPDAEVTVHYPLPENEALDGVCSQEKLYVLLLQEESFNTCCNKLFKRPIIINSNIAFIVGRKNGEDRRFVIDFLKHCGAVCYTPYTGYYYRFVSTSAIQASHKDYIDNYLRQYHEDFELFEALGVDRVVIEENSGYKLLAQAIVGLYFAENKLMGQERRTVIESIVYNGEIRKHLYKNWDKIISQKTRYEKSLFFMIRAKSVLGLRIVMLTMKTKNSIMGSKIR